jgi:hypothetical protein
MQCEWTKNDGSSPAYGSRGWTGVWGARRKTRLVGSLARRVELNLSPAAQAVIGPEGVARFREFWSYPDGWDFGRGKALTGLSVSRFERFVAEFNDFGGTLPSLFLSRDGNLVLAWEDSNGHRIEVEFSRDTVLFWAGDDSERSFTIEEYPRLIASIPR